MNDFMRKAVYLGMGLATYAAEKAEGNIQNLRSQAQKIADEMIARGEMTAEEARKYVDDLVKKAQQPTVNDSTTPETPKEPRRIEILDEDEEPKDPNPPVEDLRQQVEKLQEELRKLQRE